MPLGICIYLGAMRDDNNGFPLIMKQGNKLHNFVPRAAIERSGWLITKYEERIGNNSPSNRHTLLLPP